MSSLVLPDVGHAVSEHLIAACRERSIDLLRENLSPLGVLAAQANEQSRARAYTSIFGRDAAICALGMAVSDDDRLAREAATAMHTLAAHQARTGQIPKFVSDEDGADFWYVGCIDSTLWWLLAIAFLDRQPLTSGIRTEHRAAIENALRWLEAQEHQRFFLLSQNEASDWADIMPRSGFVLYTNAMWLLVKKLYGLDHQAQTLEHGNALLFPFDAPHADYRRVELMAEQARRRARRRGLYLSFMNFSFFGDEGDVFGNALALLCGLADGKRSQQVIDQLLHERVNDRYPVRATCEPIGRRSPLWRSYMLRHRQNLPWQYHNGGVWPMIGGFWILALLRAGRGELAREELLKLAHACALDDWRFSEWFNGRTFEAAGMARQSWNAASFLMAEHAMRTGGLSVFGLGGVTA